MSPASGNSSSAGQVRRIVIGADVLARSFFSPHCYRVMQSWRDGAVQLVVSRALVVQYLGALSKLGIPPELIRKWAWWFTASEKVVFVDPAQSETGNSVLESCAVAGGAEVIVTFAVATEEGPPAENVPPRISPKDFLH